MTDKRTAVLKHAIFAATERAGKGDIAAYLERQGEENPVAFMTFSGTVLPLQIQGDRDNPGRHQTSVTFRVVQKGIHDHRNKRVV